MKYILSQEEMDEFNSDNNVSTTAALELRVKELEYGIGKFFAKSNISTSINPAAFGGLSVRFEIESDDIPESISIYVRDYR